MTFCTNCGKKLTAGATKCDACGTSLVATKLTPPEALSHDTAVSKTDHLKTRITPPTESGNSEGSINPSVALGSQVGRVLGGRYQLDLCIGSGGMGEIYRARRLHIGDTVAVKVLRPDVIENEKTRQRFYREARAAAMLHHPNAVVIHDFGEDTDGTAYIVMELLTGRSLRQLLVKDGTVESKRVYGIIRQACAALDAGHRNGIVHRDIKPDNIYLLDTHDDEDHIKILDFGIAKLNDKALDTLSVEEQRLTNVGTIIGTPHYMSPEQCHGEEADARSDIYSLGIVLYEMLTGVVPFLAKTPTGVAIKHVTEPPRPLRELNPAVSPAIEAVVLRALDKNPNSRPQTAVELSREFDAALRREVNYEFSTEKLAKSDERSDVQNVSDTPAKEESYGTAVLPPAKDTGSQRPVETRPQSYDTIIAPPSETDALGQQATGVLPSSGTELLQDAKKTGEQRLGTFDLKTQVAEPTEKAPLAEKKPETVKPAQPARTTKVVPDEEPAADSSKPGKNVEKDKKGVRTPPDKKPEKKVEPVKAVPPIGQPTSAGKTAVATSSSQTKSRAPLLIGVVVLLAVVAGLGAWLLGGGSEKTETPSTTTSSQNTSTVSPTSSSNTQFPQQAAPEGMVFVLGGVLQVGRDDGELNERPAHVVNIKQFFIDRTEVTNQQYQKFIDEAGHPAPPSWNGNRLPAGAEQFPVTDVTWEDATAYANWAGKRLPTEEEWEYAARGSNPKNIYPWGEDWREEAANVMKDQNDKRELMTVGQLPNGVSPFGVVDLIGNVWEWTTSDYKEYPGGTVEALSGFKNLKVIRGGSYQSLAVKTTASLRRGWPASRGDWPGNRKPDYGQTGFRCAQDAKSQ